MRLDYDRLFRPGGGSGFPRMPAIAAGGMVATSHPLATRAGLRALEEGGNAVDAALAAAAVLPVVEPNLNGLGGDCMAQVWHDGELVGLNGSGRSPAALDHGGVDRFGPRSVTTPGAVAAWFDLADRFGRVGLDRALTRGAALADRGVAHAQVVDAVVTLGRDPQSALDQARFRVEPDGTVRLEPGLWERADELERLGHRVLRAREPSDFGVGQMVIDLGESLVGGSDGRGDGYAGGL